MEQRAVEMKTLLGSGTLNSEMQPQFGKCAVVEEAWCWKNLLRYFWCGEWYAVTWNRPGLEMHGCGSPIPQGHAAALFLFSSVGWMLRCKLEAEF